MRPEASFRVLPTIVTQHAEEASHLWSSRHRVLRYARLKLPGINNYDARIASHIDGLRVCVEGGASPPDLDQGTPGALFASAVLALESGGRERIEALIARAVASEDAAADVSGALGWVSAGDLQETANALLVARAPSRRSLGIGCCVMHGVDPGRALDANLTDPDAALRQRALAAAGQLGRTDQLARCQTTSLEDEDPGCRAAAAASAVMLGDRNRALNLLVEVALAGAAGSEGVLQLLIPAMSPTEAHGVLHKLSRNPQDRRLLVGASGIAGETAYVPWLVEHMREPALARPAAESFSLITGVDIDETQMWAPRPHAFESGPTEDPDDENVDLDPDEGLLWPDVEKIAAWWERNSGRFQKGQRYFMGAPVTREHCIHVLKTGYQRQRVLAAHHLCLLEPGTPLFNTSAPAWRQQRLLDRMR